MKEDKWKEFLKPTVRMPGMGPVQLTEADFDQVFVEIAPITREGGKVLKQFRFRFDTKEEGPILTEDPMDRTFVLEDFKIQPMPTPSAAIFYLDHAYPVVESAIGRDYGDHAPGPAQGPRKSWIPEE